MDLPLVPQDSTEWPSNPIPIPNGRELNVFPITADMLKGTNIEVEDFNLTNTKPQDMEYIMIRVPRRGKDGAPLDFNFTVNPHSIHVNYTTVDAQSMVRSGWTFGVWGDNLVEINMECKTGAYYFEAGLNNSVKESTPAYRNLMFLMSLVCNNGSWFEGEGLGYDHETFARMRTKSHEDVILVYNNFIWHGMFTSLTIAETADSPYFDTFSLSFLAWKERYRSSSPWINSQRGLYRGHVLPPPSKKETKETPTPSPIANAGTAL
jgi:hypothetical protein